MATYLSLPTKNNTSLVSSEAYSNHGSWTTQAIELVYDDILRYNKGSRKGISPNPTSPENFDYNNFHSNMLWWIDGLINIESTYRKTIKNKTTSAYGLTQFIKDAIPTARNRYTGAIDNWNDRFGSRGWVPHDGDRKIEYPEWVTKYKDGDDHIAYLDSLSYDQVSALTILHAHSSATDDFNWVKIQDLDLDAAKSIYSVGHHTKPDQATLDRMDEIFIIKKDTAESLFLVMKKP
tara:strand:- start:11510 stop:12214 length:705 start_codon:yes stop_codon:yes gene_type:complete